MSFYAMKYCLVLGAKGQVGNELCTQLAAAGAEVHAFSREQLDLTDLNQVEALIQKLPGIDYLFNAAAYTAVDKAESEPDLADLLNHRLPALLAQLSKKHGFKLIHYSSDYVYPGTGSQAYTETSATGPLSVYGRTKLAGDQAVSTFASNALILRTSWVYAAEGKNFLNTMLKLAQQRNELAVVGDQIGTPTPASFIAEMSLILTELGEKGVFHTVPDGYTSWAGFAEKIFQQAECSTNVISITSNEYPTAAQRPFNSRLSNSKLSTAVNRPLPGWETLFRQTYTANKTNL